MAAVIKIIYTSSNLTLIGNVSGSNDSSISLELPMKLIQNVDNISNTTVGYSLSPFLHPFVDFAPGISQTISQNQIVTMSTPSKHVVDFYMDTISSLFFESEEDSDNSNTAKGPVSQESSRSQTIH